MQDLTKTLNIDNCHIPIILSEGKSLPDCVEKKCGNIG